MLKVAPYAVAAYAAAAYAVADNANADAKMPNVACHLVAALWCC